MKKLKNIFMVSTQFTNFALVGISNTAISYFSYAILVYNKIHPQMANLIAFFVSVTNAYILNRFWVFKRCTNVSYSTPIKFFIVYGSNLLLGITLLYFYIDVFHVNKYIAPLLSLPLTVPMNYFLNRCWVFKNK